MKQAELDQLNEWLKQDEQNRLTFDSLKNYWYSNLTNRDNAQEVFNRISYRNETGNANKNGKTRHMSTSWYRSTWLKVAATIAVVFGFSGIFYVSNYQSKDIENLVVLIEKKNPSGQKMTHMLSDGTVVKLNAQSTLTYPEKFIGNTREVTLQGEAFFEVTKDEKKPFIVKSGFMSTTVLGTSFNVTAFPSEEILRVALVTGKVRVENHSHGILDERQVTIESGQMVTYTKRHSKAQVSDSFPEEIIAWRDKILWFRDSELIDMIRTLERWYGVNFTIRNSKALDRKFTGKFKDRSLEYVLDVLSYDNAFDYQFEGKNVLIIGN